MSANRNTHTHSRNNALCSWIELKWFKHVQYFIDHLVRYTLYHVIPVAAYCSGKQYPCTQGLGNVNETSILMIDL